MLDTATGQATHVVVRMSNGLLVPRDVVVPLTWARTVTPDRIELVASRDDLLGMPEYRDDDEIRADFATAGRVARSVAGVESVVGELVVQPIGVR